MKPTTSEPLVLRHKMIFLVAALIVLSAAAGYGVYRYYPPGGKVDARPAEKAEASEAEVMQMCAYCHKFPPPWTFPKHEWRKEVKQGYNFFYGAKHDFMTPPDFDSVVRFYENRAPDELKFEHPPTRKDMPIRFQQEEFLIPSHTTKTAISNVNLVRLTHKTKLDVLICDMYSGYVSVFKPYDPDSSFVIGRVGNPCHTEVVDLDGDGILDVLVADLGSFLPTDNKCGKVVWFKGNKNGSFTSYTLLENVGRVAEVQAANFNGDGKTLDLIVAEFGWRDLGQITYLQNKTVDWKNPVFVPHMVDKRHGAINVPVIDLNGDGKLDFVALISQEHETVVAFLNEGKGKDGTIKFRPEVLFEADQPSYGSSGIQLVDLNNDGKMDVLYTNGDSLDSGHKPWHSVQWLENEGKFPFRHHPITTFPGASRAVAVKLPRRDLPDIFAVSFIPEPKPFDSILYLKQETPGNFVRYSMERENNVHATCAIGDLDGDGKMHLVTARFHFHEMSPRTPTLSIWRNLGPP